ncbi:MAG: hypothetical protein MUF61_00250 [archaeon]|jgi:uncharacterized membrane protein|nr:hypothetical protein [archaeon]
MPKKAVKKEDDSKLFAFLAVLLTIIGFIIAFALRKNNQYVMFYAKQGLVLFISSVVIWVAALVPILGGLLASLLWICWILLWVVGIIYSLSGKMKPVPIIGQFADKINV